MNVIPRYDSDAPIQHLMPESEQTESELAAIVGIIRRQLPFMLLMGLLGLAAAGLYLFTATRWYTADVQVLMETRRNMALEQEPWDRDRIVETAMVESQVETIKSERISRAVVKALNLAEDPEFTRPAPGPLGLVRTVLGAVQGPPRELSPEEKMDKAISRFADRLDAKRVGVTYAIEISFVSLSPEKAARIANQTAEAYIADQLQSKFEATERAEAWLQERVNELRDQASAAEKAVLQYKLDNRIVTAEGRLMDDATIANFNQKLNEARSQVTDAQARLARITEIIDSNDVDAAVTDAMSNNIISQLRQRYLEAAARASDWSKRYGERHNAVITLRNEMRGLQQSIMDELKRIQENHRSELEIAKAREQAAEKALSEGFQTSGESRLSQVKLRELEGIAENARALYDSYVQRRLKAAQLQTLPVTEARVITAARPPSHSSHPKLPIVMALGLAGGLGAGVGIGFLRELLNRTVRNKRQLERASGAPCLGLLPKLKTGAKRNPGSDRIKEIVQAREVVPLRSELAVVSRAPFSQFAEGIRSIKLAADLNLARGGGRGVVIGVVSSLPGEGKSIVSSNLGFLTAQTGSRVLLIDCDLRNPTLSRGLAPWAEQGVADFLKQAVPSFDDLTWRHPKSGLDFLPAHAGEMPDNASTLLSSGAMHTLLEEARARYEYIVIDFAPMLPVIDVRAVANFVDAFVLVAEWAKTPTDAVSEAVSLSSAVHTRLIGTVLNKVDMRQMRRYGDYNGKYYLQYFDR